MYNTHIHSQLPNVNYPYITLLKNPYKKREGLESNTMSTNRYDNRITITTPKGRKRLETDIAWELFCEYRDMGKKRSYQKVANHFNRSLPYIQEVAEKYDWQNRIHEMVDDQKKADKKKKLKDKKNTIKRHRNLFRDAQAKLLRDIEKIDEDDTMSNLEKAKAKAPLYDKLFRAVEGERTANYLPKQYNDKQKVEAETKITGDIKNQLLFKDKESFHKQVDDDLNDLLE